jgi:segregation and condensation protein A
MSDDAEGESERTPLLILDGYNGSLEGLLTLARSRRIDLSEIPLLELVDQLVAAIQDAPEAAPMGQKGEWVVMAAWLVQLRSLLLLPADAPRHLTARDEADRFRERLARLAAIQALAAWLDARPHLGRDVFVQGQPLEGSGGVSEAEPEIDVMEFLWATMAASKDGTPGPEASETYRPRWRDLYSIPEARARMLRRLAETPVGLTLEQLLPDETTAAAIPAEPALTRRAAWTSTFVAGLELAKQGDVALRQRENFTTVHVSPAPMAPPD